MNRATILKLPDNFDWRHWVQRWDQMQECHLVQRGERIQLMVDVVRHTVGPVRRVVDLGCGTGSLIQTFLDAFPEVEVYGIDYDPVLLPLAQERLRSYGPRARIILADLRRDGWQNQVPPSVDSVISATALHWLTEPELSALYRQISTLLRPGGIFLNADHVASRHPGVQTFWEKNRAEMRRREMLDGGEVWEAFWEAYAGALGLTGKRQIKERVLGGWEGGVEEGLSLEWHFAALQASGFSHPECFWRCDCDAIYGAFR